MPLILKIIRDAAYPMDVMAEAVIIIGGSIITQLSFIEDRRANVAEHHHKTAGQIF